MQIRRGQRSKMYFSAIKVPKYNTYLLKGYVIYAIENLLSRFDTSKGIILWEGLPLTFSK